MSHAEHTNRSRRLWQIVLAVCCALFLAAAAVLLALYLPRRTPVPPLSSAPAESVVSEPAPLPENPIDFPALLAENPETVGWIRIPDTVIDYAVMQSTETAENFYLSHGFNRKYKFAGCIYIQKLNRADFSDPNTVLYGHNMKNGSMFANLHKFEKEDFFKTHDTMYVYTPGHILTYRIYSAFVYDDRHVLYAFDFTDPAERQLFINETLSPASMKRQVREGVTVTPEDRIITLSTCTKREGERYLVEGVLIHDQPTR